MFSRRFPKFLLDNKGGESVKFASNFHLMPKVRADLMKSDIFVPYSP
jgi:hypothetical protein